jgi:hypothetical protein
MSDADVPPVAGIASAGNILRLALRDRRWAHTLERPGWLGPDPARIRRQKERSPGRGRSGALVQRSYHDSG